MTKKKQEDGRITFIATVIVAIVAVVSMFGLLYDLPKETSELNWVSEYECLEYLTYDDMDNLNNITKYEGVCMNELRQTDKCCIKRQKVEVLK